LFLQRVNSRRYALAAMLASEKDGLFVKHAALCGNHLCEMNVPNKLAFMEHGGGYTG
jgi:hypothetical protein